MGTPKHGGTHEHIRRNPPRQTENQPIHMVQIGTGTDWGWHELGL
tara:strand:- start:2354 stop:2488 length:135 start_codon:yes stop_codon:yes gene_type:complete